MKHDYTEGSENIFKDLGSVNPEEKIVKAELIFIILTSSDNGTTWAKRTSGTSNGLLGVTFAE